MTCPQCGNENPPKLKFCVKCGMNLENPQEINYEQVDLGNYHSEEDQSSGKFSLGSGTFTIRDSASVSDTSSDFYTADELNSDEEEFDFSSFDEPFIPKLDADRLSLPAMNQTPPQSVPQNSGMRGLPPQQPHYPSQQPAVGGIPQAPQTGGMPAMTGISQPIGMNGMPQMQQMNAIPPQSAPVIQPQIIGYDQNGMPVYGQAQPVMFAQPQIIGYDQNGMPVYGQAQPVMYPQQPVQPPVQGDISGMQNMNGMPGMPQMGGMPSMQPFGQTQQKQPVKKERVEVSDDFWKFFDGGKSADHNDSDDFFGSRDMDSVSASGLDVSRLKRFEHKKNDFMSDTPLVDGSQLAANTEAKFNKLYMRRTETVNANDLEAKKDVHTQDIMGVTKDVDAGKLNAYQHYKSRISMEYTDSADASKLEAYNPEHTESIMLQADHAVEALPKKKTTYVDEIDAIELPEYMQARKTVRDDTPQIPELPENNLY